MIAKSLLALLFTPVSAPASAPPDFRFHVEILHTGSAQPMNLAVAGDGQVYFTEIAGKVLRLDPATKITTTLAHLTVTNEQENGLIGMALDPAFSENHWMYLYHSPLDFEGQILSRFTLSGERLDSTSRVDILKVPEQRNQCCHHGGTIRFDSNGLLHLSTGDNTSPFASDGFTPIDERAGRGSFDAQKSSANTNDLRGKILRIKVHPDGSYTIPKGNLFPEGTPKTRPEIFAMGFRNPWRFSIDPKTNWLYVGDVGPDSGKDHPGRGPRGYDILYQIRSAANFGWPHVRAGQPYHDFDFATDQSGPKFNPQAPLNQSPNNTGLKKLPPVAAPFISYPHAKIEKYALLGSGGRTSCGGPAFHFKPEFKDTGGFPEYFDKAVLHFDWQRPFLVWVRLNNDGSFQKLEPFTKIINISQGAEEPGQPLKIRRPADMVFGPDGALYLLDYGETWGVNKDARLLRISYLRGELPPVAKAHAHPVAGPAPLTTTLSASGSFSPARKRLTYEWTLLPDNTPLGTGESLEATITKAGNHIARLTVRDSVGATSTLDHPLTVGNSPPAISPLRPASRSLFVPGQKISYAFRIDDAEEGSSEDKPDSFGPRTLVTAQWIGRDGRKIEADPGLRLMKQSDCFNCHAVQEKLVGPSLMEISTRYRGQKDARLTATERVVKGSAGVWSEIPMLPHPQHSMDEAHLMVSWIFSLDPGKPVTSMQRGLSGEITVPSDPGIGSAIIEATFTDIGNAPADPLTSTQSITLLHHRLEAESAILHGPTLASQREASNGQVVNRIEPGRSLSFEKLDLSGMTKVSVRAASTHAPGATIELRSGGKDGPVLATIPIHKTGGNSTYQTFTAALTPPGNPDALTLVFQSPKKGRLMLLDWVEFKK